MNNIKLSVVLATRNEEANIEKCLRAVKDIADEIIVIDEYSEDKTREVARALGAKVYLEPHHDIFHITKQKALDKASGSWILQLDADEVVSIELAKEIKEVVNMGQAEIRSRRLNWKKLNLFKRHERLIEKRDGKIGKDTRQIVAFFIPRLNMFLGSPLKHAGVYPDPSIRLIKNGKARFPQKSVHEIMEIDGEVAWLQNDLEHYDSPTFSRYIQRANRYTNLTAQEFKREKLPKNFSTLFYYSFIKPISFFTRLYFRHLGFLDGNGGFLWSAFSAIHFPLAYYKYWNPNLHD